MTKSSVLFPEFRPAMTIPVVPGQRLWPRLREAGSALVHRLVKAQMTAVRGYRPRGFDCGDAMPFEFRRLPRRLWQRHSAYLVYGRQIHGTIADSDDMGPARTRDVVAARVDE